MTSITQMNVWNSRFWKPVARFWGRAVGQDGATSSVVAAPETFSIQAYMASDAGRVRSTNQDAIVFVAPGNAQERGRRGVLAVVADGMGGHRGGEVASSLAVQTISRRYFAASTQDPLASLNQAVQEANIAIHTAGAANPELAGMGTTTTALVLLGDKALLAHIGDTRLYRCTNGQAVQLTEDDTWVQEMEKNGILTAEEARNHPERNVLLRSLGTHPQVDVIVTQLDPPMVGECFVLCSDGLYGAIDSVEIAHAVASFEPEAACHHLIELARNRDGSDNISIGVVAIGPVAAPDKPQRPTRETTAMDTGSS